MYGRCGSATIRSDGGVDTSPARAGHTPSATRSSDDFPQPFGPETKTWAPCGTEAERGPARGGSESAGGAMTTDRSSSAIPALAIPESAVRAWTRARSSSGGAAPSPPLLAAPLPFAAWACAGSSEMRRARTRRACAEAVAAVLCERTRSLQAIPTWTRRWSEVRKYSVGSAPPGAARTTAGSIAVKAARMPRWRNTYPSSESEPKRCSCSCEVRPAVAASEACSASASAAPPPMRATSSAYSTRCECSASSSASASATPVVIVAIEGPANRVQQPAAKKKE
mmetsp:Transcript_15058/g.48119  ORF Transcript_15058/g.48119 Transcript_15058/m.48119 type:complete len:282 (+) Transcript_15058:756-1601(+)